MTKTRSWASLFFTGNYLRRVTLTCILLITIPLLFAGFLADIRFYSFLEKTTQNQTNQIAIFTNNRLTNFFSSIGDLTILPLYDHDLILVLKAHTSKENSNYVGYEEKQKIVSFLSGINYDIDEIIDTSFYCTDHFILNQLAYEKTAKWSPEDNQWMSYCDQNKLRPVIIPAPNAVDVARSIQEPIYASDLGYIRIRISGSALETIVSEAGLPEGSYIKITNQFGQQIYPFSSENKIPDFSDPKIHENFLKSNLYSEETGLTIQVLFSLASLQKETVRTLKFVIEIILFSLFTSYALAILASVRLTKPIYDLIDQMNKVGKGNFGTLMEVSSIDEIGQLQRNFNRMTSSLQSLVTEVYEKSLASKEAQISALQSQINPHFLYNTLETINMLAISNEQYQISEAVSNLGWMMRYCVSNEDHQAYLSDEIKFVKTYYEIQCLRFENLHSLCINVDDDCWTLPVPKLILQPFVENIIQHAIGDYDLDIVVKSFIEGQFLIMTIQNNGKDLDEETKQMIRDKLSHERAFIESKPEITRANTKKGYGLSNVQHRIQLLYGEDSGIFIDDSFVDGARFIIKLKMGNNIRNAMEK